MPGTSALLDSLRRQLAADGGRGALCIAFSGGADSSALLHALAQLPEARARGLRALHIDHALHPHSLDWAAHAAAQCAAWEVPLTVIRVQVARDGQGLEAAARQARYAAFAAALAAGEMLLLAHHRDDQVETVLLKLLRGAGPEGLAGMRARRPLGLGQLWRPLLELPRERLREYLQSQGLSFIEDPSNADTRLSRNQLRREILPRLLAHWPHAAESILHSARLSREADDALRQHWLAAYATLVDPATGSLDAPGWLALAPGLRNPLLDHWLHAQGLPAPTTAQRAQIEHQQRHALPDRLPCVRWRGAELHLWRARWWATPPLPTPPPDWQQPWHGEPLALPGGGRLALRPVHADVAPFRLPMLHVRLRRGGERLKPVGHAHTRELRDLFQQGAMPPWLRPLCPLIYEGEQLIAVADRWCSERGRTLFAQAGAEPVWEAVSIDSDRLVQ
jgi:tRNA(Ile)-lysidine synthase